MARLIAFCYVVFSHCDQEACYFLKENGRGVDLERGSSGNLGEVEGEEATVGMYCRREE